jgi:hypothetical protein
MADDVSRCDLNQLANVHWYPAPRSRDGPSIEGALRRFGTLTDAVRFVMEELPFYAKQTAWITTDSGIIENAAIMKLYSKMR